MKEKTKGFFKNITNVLDKAKDQGINTIQKVTDGSVDVAQKLAKNAQEGALDIAEKVTDAREKKALKKYNPIYLEEFKSENFNIPNVVMIVDDATSRNQEDISDGSIGYRSTVKDLEVLKLYDETVPLTGLSFVPMISLESLYYVDPHDRKRFIQLEGYFERMQESKLAELQHIAYSLGAKRYSVELVDIKETISDSKKKKNSGASKNGISTDISQETSSRAENRIQKQLVASAEFSGDMKPVQPLIKWFSQDDNIKNLINMRCVNEGRNTLKYFDITFKGNQYSSMSKSTASKIDAAASKLASVNLGFEVKSKVSQEHQHSLVFHIEFE